MRQPLLLAPRLFFLFRLLHSVSLGAFKAVIRSAHECASYSAASVGFGFRKIVLGWDWAFTRPLCEAIHASAAASVSKRLTVVGLVSGIETLTPNPPASSGTIS